jgi:leucine dehydrogenase
VATACAQAGATLLVTDIDPRKRALADSLNARWVEPEEALSAPVDVFAPCALGGVLDHESVLALGAPIVAGAANNQLAGDSVAHLLVERGVLWAPDFVANAGGVINISVELAEGGYDPRRAGELVRGIGVTLELIFQEAAARGVSPLDAALGLARERLADAASG